MKTYKTIDDAIYEIAAEQIEKRRRNPTAWLILLFAGLALAGSVYFFDGIVENSTVANIMLLTGMLAAVAGLVKTIINFTSRSKLYYKPSGSALRRYELRFDMPYMMKVRQCLEDGDLAALARLPHGRSADVKAVIYKTEDNGVMLGQAFGFKKPLGETKIFEKGAFTLTERLA